MQIKEIWPFLLPGVLLQLLMQILCIVEGVREDNRKPFHRALYILSIAIFGLAAIAFHLLRAEKTPPKDTTTAEVERANHLTNKGIFFLLLIAYQVMGLHMLAENVGTPTYVPLIWLLSISFLIMLLYNLLPEKKRLISEPLLPMLQLVLCIPIQYLDISGDNLFLSIIAGFSAINHASLPRAKIYGIGALGAYLLGSTTRTILLSESAELADLVRYFFVNTIVVLLALIAFYTLKKQMITSVKLESALRTVKEQSEKLKGLAVVEERNRIAAEMHDTVGHTLTAAVLTLEAAEGLVSESQVAQKLHQGKEQVRRGLSELRASVKVVRAGNETDFVTILEQLFQEIRFDTGLDIHLVMESEITLPPLQAGILLSAVKECTTNAIRHGQATHVDILIGEYKGQLRLAFSDNGSGTNDIKFGSGLSIMRERVQSVGGTLEIENAPGEGFTVSLIIPAVQRKEDVQ
ncbi:MAG: sensor histidine kinase [Candidatus Pelethousia sp.]|nr:sensor histidine kinase [Candidatus Pelethousia sp.]